jgi:molecular chaperone DnaK (HSP70)
VYFFCTESYAIGIDLGTTNSCAAVYRNGKVEMIYSDTQSDKNKTTTPSVVYFGENEILFGETAVVKGFVDPENCISGEILRIFIINMVRSQCKL